MVTKVVSAAAGMLARNGSASSAEKAICATGNRMPVTMPNATPRGTERRVARHSAGWRTRWATGRSQRLRSNPSRVGMLRRPQATARPTRPGAE